MTSTERQAGWLFLITSAVALVSLYFVESFSMFKLLAGYFWLSGTALSALVANDLFHRDDVAIRRRTLLSVVAWIVPCAPNFERS